MSNKKYIFNPFTGKLDAVRSDTYIDSKYLRLDTSNSPLTGKLEIVPSSGDTALKTYKDIVLVSGQKIIFNG